MTIFWPSTHPSSRSLCRNASTWCGLSEGDVTPRKPIRGTFPACCASAASGAASRLRVSVTMHQTVLHHIVISSQRPHADRLLLKPNAALQARPIAGARDEQRLLGVACKRLFGADVPQHPVLRAPPPDDARTPSPSPQGTPKGLPYPIMRRLSSTSQQRAGAGAAGGAARKCRLNFLYAVSAGVWCDARLSQRDA